MFLRKCLQKGILYSKLERGGREGGAGRGGADSSMMRRKANVQIQTRNISPNDDLSGNKKLFFVTDGFIGGGPFDNASEFVVRLLFLLCILNDIYTHTTD